MKNTHFKWIIIQKFVLFVLIVLDKGYRYCKEYDIVKDFFMYISM